MDSLFRQANKHLPARGKMYTLQRYKRKVDITMKYRIVKNGLGTYAVQFKRWWGWQFWKVDDGDGEYCRLEFNSEAEAHQAVADSVTAKQSYEERNKKAKTWEVVG